MTLIGCIDGATPCSCKALLSRQAKKKTHSGSRALAPPVAGSTGYPPQCQGPQNRAQHGGAASQLACAGQTWCSGGDRTGLCSLDLGCKTKGIAFTCVFVCVGGGGVGARGSDQAVPCYFTSCCSLRPSVQPLPVHRKLRLYRSYTVGSHLSSPPDQ